ncbi:MAG: 30S ribosomal protein S13 [Candidatus Anammoxibacter sp.]
MPRIAGIDIPGDKRIIIALTYIFGVGKVVAKEVLDELKIDENTRAKDVHEDAISAIGSHLSKNYMIEGQLRRHESQNISRLKNISSYRGLRHRLGLPVRGQRTNTNARTRKGRKKTVAGKKGDKGIR